MLPWAKARTPQSYREPGAPIRTPIWSGTTAELEAEIGALNRHNIELRGAVDALLQRQRRLNCLSPKGRAPWMA